MERAGVVRQRVTVRWNSLTAGQAVGVAALVGALTNLTALGYQPLAWTETVTASAADRSLPHLVTLLRHTDLPLGAYYLLMHGWVRLLAMAGVFPSEGWLRLPGALAASGAVVLTAALTARWWGPKPALLAGTLLAVNPLLVFNAHDARPYGFVVLLTVAASAVLLETLAQPTVPRLAGYAVLAVGAVCAHLFAVLALAAHAPVIVRYGVHRWRWAAVGVLVAAAAVPLAVIGSGQVAEIGWVPAPSLAGVASVLLRVGGGAMVVPLAALAVLAARGTLRHAADRTRPDTLAAPADRTRPDTLAAPADRTRPDTLAAPADHTPDRRTPWTSTAPARLLVLGWAAVPPLTLVLADFVRPVLVARYMLDAAPALAIGAAVTARRLGTRGKQASTAPVTAGRLKPHARAAVALVAVAIIAGAATSAVQQAQPYKYENYRAAADMVADSSRRGDGLVFIPASNRVGLARYLGQDREDRFSTPPDIAAQPGDGPLVAGQIAGGQITPTALGRLLPRYDRLFLIGASLGQARASHHGPDELVVERALAAGYRQDWSRRYGDVTVSLFVRAAPPQVAAPGGAH